MEFVLGLLQAMILIGVEELRNRYFADTSEPIDLSTGPVHGELHATFVAAREQRPLMVMVGLVRGDSWRFSVPMKYGDRLRLRLERGVYQVTALFFAEAPENRALTLVAIARHEIRILSDGPEKFVVRGQAVDDAERAEIESAVRSPAEPARLPVVTARASFAPSIEILSAPICDFRAESGERCAVPVQESRTNGRRCPRHADGDAEFGIIAWAGHHPSDNLSLEERWTTRSW
uniref:hypothetical protein n=1 Tax=Herbidospora sakaeratensis TaxID=564415 RepID=UPI000786481A|nr:hypothetical protein [Herbidospora sakaeratensis]